MSEYSPRRKPQQARSRRTWEAIVGAASEMLVEVGYAEMSTNKIAEHADVSVGSIYQYFPNKEAIVVAVLDQFSERQFEILADGLEQARQAGLEEAVETIVGNMLEAKRDDPELSRVLFEELPPVGQYDVHNEWRRRATDLVREALQARDETLEPRDLEMAAFVLVNAMNGIVQATVANRPELLDGDELLEETVELVLGYLT